MKTLPGDDVRQVMWRFTERFDLQMVVQSARSVARGPVARLVADGARNTHEWTSGKNSLLDAFDQAGITSLFMEPEWGGYIAGPKNMALALTAFELGWVDGGSATCSLAGCLALSPIHEKGTEEQKAEYMSKAVPSATGGKTSRGAFALTEPLPYVGVDASMLAGKVRVAEWKDGEEPLLQVEKRGRFITNMDFADFVTAAVSSDDERIKGSCMVILEEEDEGLFDRGAPTLKLVHQLSSTRDPIFNLRVPASRIIGGYTIQDGIIVPNFSHNEVIEAVFRRTRVTVGVMTAAKLLSAVEPVIRYHRQRFRGGEFANPGSPRFDQGLQQKEDTLHRLAEVWAAGEAAASLGFAAARCFDELDPVFPRRCIPARPGPPRCAPRGAAAGAGSPPVLRTTPWEIASAGSFPRWDAPGPGRNPWRAGAGPAAANPGCAGVRRGCRRSSAARATRPWCASGRSPPPARRVR